MDMTTNHISRRRRWLIVALILVPVFIGALDLTIVSAILPEVLTKLNIPVDTNLGAAAWAITGYLLAYTVSMMVMGRVSDLVGRRSVYLICLAIFIVGSYWVATAHLWPTDMLNLIARQFFHQRPDINQLTLVAIIIGRVIQALGAGAMVPVSIALVADLFPAESRAQPVGLIGAVDTLGWVLGHLYGGLMVNFFSTHGDAIAATLQQLGLNLPAPDWRTLFFLNIPIGLVALALTWWVLRGVAHPAGRGRFDVIGMVLIAVALIGLNVGLGGSADITGSVSLDTLNQQASNTPLNLPLLAGAGLAFLIFLFYEWRVTDPLIDLHLFRKRNISAASATNLLVGFCLMLGLVSVPLSVNLQAKDTSSASLAAAAERAGILLSGLTLPMALAAIPGGWLANRMGYRRTVVLGMILAAAGFFIAGLTWADKTPALTMASHMVLVGIGLGLTISPIGTAVINDVDDSRRGVASALVIILRLVGMTLAISSLVGFALTRIAYLVNIARQSFPANLTPDQFQQASLHAYYVAGLQMINEMLLIGGVTCVIALIPALFLQGKAHAETPSSVAEGRILEQRPSSGR